jgi:hypothetical protein
MWLGIKNVIRANHMISLITSSTTDPILSSATCRTVNVMDIFNSAPRRRYGDRLYISPIIHDNFLQTMQKPSGMHHIRTKLFHYLNQNHIPCTTRVWKTTLQSEFKRIQTYSKRLDIAGESYQTCCHLKKWNKHVPFLNSRLPTKVLIPLT